jgi:uncharacterized protein
MECPELGYSMEHHKTERQYSLQQILIIQGAAMLPMGLARFVLMPLLMPVLPLHAGILFWILMILGMGWLFVLSLIILRIELGPLTWRAVKTRLWLNHPISPTTGNRCRRAYWLTIPLILYAFMIESSGLFGFIESTFNSWFPMLAPPPFMAFEGLMTPEWQGKHYLYVLLFFSCLFNYLLGEELLFRGILLPKMRGVFGKWDWVMNGVLFSIWHVHKITEIPLFLAGSFFIAFLNRRYRSFWPAIIIHGV